MTSTCLIIWLFATLAAADVFSDCVVRQKYSVDGKLDVEAVTDSLMEAVHMIDAESCFTNGDVKSFVDLLIATDCSEFQARIEKAFSSNNVELEQEHTMNAVMGYVHELDAPVVGTRRRRLHPLLVVGAGIGAAFAVAGGGTAAFFHWFGRRELVNMVRSISPIDVMQACEHGATSSVCAGSLSELAKDMSMTMCGGLTEVLTCDISLESFKKATAEVCDPGSVAMNLEQGQEKEVGYRLRKINKSLREAVKNLVN